MAALDTIASELLKSANEADLNYKKTRDQTQLDKAVRLRRIVENLRNITLGASDLNGLSDVTLTSVTNGQVLLYDGATEQWINGSISGGGDMLKAVYDPDDDGVVDASETVQIIVRNSTGSTLSKGSVVYLSGATGNRPNAVLAQANSEMTSSKTIGIVIANIANNADGYVAVSGTLHDLDTSAFTAGDAVWLSPTVAGGITTTVPSEPNHSVFVGYIARSHPTQGRLVIAIQNGYELNELHNVVVPSPSNGDLLQYDSANLYWKNVPVATAVPTPTLAQVTTAGNTTTNAITVGGLTVGQVGGNGVINFPTSTSGFATSIYSTYAGNSLTFQIGSRTLQLNGGGQLNTNFNTTITGSTGAAALIVQQGSAAWSPVADFNGLSGTALRVNTNGNILIGTTTDVGYKLDVNGSLRVVLNAWIRGHQFSEAGNVHTYQVGYGAYGQFELKTANGAQFVLRATETGRVGIGTTTPSAKLQVSDSITASSALAQGVYFNNTLVAAANNDVLVGLDINPTFTNGAFTGVSNIGLRVSGQVLFNAYGAYNTITPTLRIENVDTNNVAIQIKGNVANYKYYWIYDSQTTEGIYKSDQARIDFYGGTNVGFAFRNNYGRLFTIVGSTGNVLIGTTTDAGYKLDVNGTARVGNDFTIDNNRYLKAYRWTNADTSFPLQLESNSTHTVTGINFISYNNNLLNNTKSLFTFGLVSPITTQSSGSVDVANVINIVPEINFAFGTHTVRGIYYNPTLTSLTGTTHRAIETTSGDVIFNGGNVGVGTSTPTDKIHIVDNTNGNKFGRISAGGTDASAAWVAQNDQVDNIVYRVFGSAVTGSQMGQALARSASLIANLGGTGKFLIGSYSGTDLIFGTSDQARMRLVDATGNFLIGTMTDNGNKLTVSGNIDAQAYKVNNVLGYTGILNIPTNPPGQQNIDIQGGIVINIF